MDDLTVEIIWISALIFILLSFAAVVAFMMDLFLNPKKERRQSYEKIDLY